MNSLYANIRDRALEIAASYPSPPFYRDFSHEHALSREFFETDPVITRLYAFVSENTDNDLGHGLPHVTKVTVDAGALVLIEGRQARLEETEIQRALLLIQCAGLLHDLERKQKGHAEKGAQKARGILAPFPLSDEEIGDVCLSIRNHEAFKTPDPAAGVLGAMISDCLYDADKFRWGPDNFTDTVWHMISFFKAPLSVFISRYPEGVRGVARIKKTFRSVTGKSYGPQFIDLGLAIGEELFRVIESEFANDAP